MVRRRLSYVGLRDRIPKKRAYFILQQHEKEKKKLQCAKEYFNWTDDY